MWPNPQFPAVCSNELSEAKTCPVLMQSYSFYQVFSLFVTGKLLINRLEANNQSSVEQFFIKVANYCWKICAADFDQLFVNPFQTTDLFFIPPENIREPLIFWYFWYISGGIERYHWYRLETADLVTFTEEILNGKLHFLCSVCG